MAYTTDGTANFNFFINRQGPRGPQGIQGPEGFSPNVEVEEDYGNTFTLRVTNKDSSFVTSNLREHKEDRGGTYVRWDRETEQLYLGDAGIPAATDSTAGIIRISNSRDIELKNDTTAITPKQLIENIDTTKEDLQASIDANTQLINSLKTQMVTLNGNQTIYDEKKFSHLITDRIYSEAQGKVFLETSSDSVTIGSDLYVSGVIRNSNGTVIDVTKLGNTLVRDSKTGKYDVRLATDSLAGIVKPDGNTITIAEDGTISSIAQGDVTAAGDNTFTGKNTFNEPLHFKSSLIADSSIFSLGRTGGDYVLYCNAQGTTLASEMRKTVILGTQILDGAGNIILSQGNVEAGDNITIDKTTKGVKISSTASGGGAEIDDTTTATDKVYSSSKTQELVDGIDDTITRLSTELSNALNTISALETNITSLETRVKALEDLIDGGNAGSTYPVELQKFSEKVVEGININEQVNSFSEDVQINEE